MSLKRLITICLVAVGIAMTAAGKTWNAHNLPMPKAGTVEEGFSFVSNPDQILCADTVRAINQLLKELEDSKGIKSLVVVVTNIEGDDPYEFGMELARTYGIGTKENTGLIYILATDDRSFQILTGRGLEAYLPDAICKRVENRVMVPLLKEGDWNGATAATIRTLKGLAEQQEELIARYASDEDEELTGMELFLALLCTFGPLGICIFAAVWQERKKKHCPQCNQYTLKLKKRICRNLSRQKMEVTEVRVCSHCGHTSTKTYVTSTGEFYEGTFTGGNFGHNYGGGSSGGGHSYGSFGGGSFGGGGAGGRF